MVKYSAITIKIIRNGGLGDDGIYNEFERK